MRLLQVASGLLAVSFAATVTATETVEVTGGAPLLKTESSEVNLAERNLGRYSAGAL